MIKKFLSLFKVKKKEETREYTNSEELYLMKKGYSSQDIEDYFFKPFYVRNSVIPYRCSYIITSRLSINYTDYYGGHIDIYFNGNIYPYNGCLDIEKYKYFILDYENNFFKSDLISICVKTLPLGMLQNYIYRIEQVGSDLAEYRRKKSLQKYRSKYFS